MKSVNANKINRKSGEAEGSAVRPGWLPRDLQCAPDGSQSFGFSHTL